MSQVAKCLKIPRQNMFQWSKCFNTPKLYTTCLKYTKNTENKNPKVVTTKTEILLLLSKCSMCDSKKSKFIKEQETSGLLSSLRIKTPVSKITSVGRLLF